MVRQAGDLRDAAAIRPRALHHIVHERVYPAVETSEQVITVVRKMYIHHSIDCSHR